MDRAQGKSSGTQGTLWFQELPGLGLHPGPAPGQSLNCEQQGGVLPLLPSDHVCPPHVHHRSHQTDTYNLPCTCPLASLALGIIRRPDADPLPSVHQPLNKHLETQVAPWAAAEWTPVTLFPGEERALSGWVLISRRKASLRPALTGESRGAYPPGGCESLGAWPRQW